jgi:hypothetical protein
MKQNIHNNQEAESHLLKLQEAMTALDRERSRTVTRRSELVTEFRAQYKGFQWDLVLPSSQNGAGVF